MFDSLEKLADKIADYVYGNKTKKHKKQKQKIVKEELNSVYYEIIPYHRNDANYSVFAKLLKNFSSFSERINFFVIGNNVNKKIIVSFPDVLEQRFLTRFYNYFPSSKIIKIGENFENNYTNLLYKNDFDQFIKIEDKIKLKDNDFFQEFFYLFKDVPNQELSCVRYSLILNSKVQEKQEDEEELKTLFELLWDAFVGLFKIVYYVLYRIFTGEKPKNNKKQTGQDISTGISGTAISIASSGESINSLFFSLLKSKLSNRVEKSKGEIFSQITITEFSKMYHIPTKDEKIEGLSYINYKRIAPPPNLPEENENITILGKADWADESQVVGLKQEDKIRHVYIIGKTGVGKSTLLSNMVLSDLEQGRGLALVDPHGDLVNTILSIVPESRKDDIVLFDVSDTQHPVGFNVFDKSNENKDLVVSNILAVFKKLYGYSWGPRLEYILRNVLLALSDYENVNFLHIMKMLTDKQFRKKVLTQVNDSVIKDFWENEFSKRSERFASEAISPIMNKIGQFVSSPIIRNIFGQNKSTIDIQEIMQNNKILLVNLSKGLIGEDNSNMVGSFIVSQIQVEAMKRANMPMNERKEFTLYIDEFQNFATESFSVILSEARKYKLSLVVANQYISQVDEKIQDAIFGNVGNILAFNSGNQDAEILTKQFKNQVTVNDITSIPKFKAYTKIMIDGTSTDVFSLSTYPIEESNFKDEKFVESLKELSNKKYTKNRKEVEKEIGEITKTSKEKIEEIKKTTKQKPIFKEEKKEVKEEAKIIDKKDLGDIYEGVIKLKFNYGLFVVAGGYEGLLHKKNINLPEGISWKDYYNIGDNIKVKLIELKEVDGQKKAVWESL